MGKTILEANKKANGNCMCEECGDISASPTTGTTLKIVLFLVISVNRVVKTVYCARKIRDRFYFATTVE